jgi:hypothetical protein
MSAMKEALDSLYLPPLFLCEWIPALSIRDRASSQYFSPEGVELQGTLIEVLTHVDRLKKLPANHRITGLNYLGENTISVSTFYQGGGPNKIYLSLHDTCPAIFETMIFTDIPDLNYWCRRFVTRAAAFNAHNQITETLTLLGAVMVDDWPQGRHLWS